MSVLELTKEQHGEEYLYHRGRIAHAARKGYIPLAHAVAACPVKYLQKIFIEHPKVRRIVLRELEVGQDEYPNDYALYSAQHYAYCVSVHSKAVDIAASAALLGKL